MRDAGLLPGARPAPGLGVYGMRRAAATAPEAGAGPRRFPEEAPPTP